MSRLPDPNTWPSRKIVVTTFVGDFKEDRWYEKVDGEWERVGDVRVTLVEEAPVEEVQPVFNIEGSPFNFHEHLARAWRGYSLL